MAGICARRKRFAMTAVMQAASGREPLDCLRTLWAHAADPKPGSVGERFDVEHTKPRIDAHEIAPEAYETMLALERYLHRCGLSRSLIELVKLRASQINGCAYCIDMHTKDARAAGETEQRLYLLDAWRESPFYSPRERAALAWTESVTRVSETHVPDEVYEEALAHFSEKEIVDLTYLAMTINSWNRLAVATRAMPGRYRPAKTTA
jgi:AhpD family alkylhydroperoxidase